MLIRKAKRGIYSQPAHKFDNGHQRVGEHGFSLIEIIIVVVILGILASIAYPSYIEYLKSGNRGDVKTQLIDFSSKIEQKKLATSTYNGITLSDLGNSTGKWPESGTALYNLTLDMNGGAWVLTASPISTAFMKNDGDIILNHKGQKCWDGSGACTLKDNTDW